MKNRIEAVQDKIMQKVILAKVTLNSRYGENFVDTAIKILMAVVIGALVLAGLYALFNDTVLPTLQDRVEEMFDYRG